MVSAHSVTEYVFRRPICFKTQLFLKTNYVYLELAELQLLTDNALHSMPVNNIILKAVFHRVHSKLLLWTAVLNGQSSQPSNQNVKQITVQPDRPKGGKTLSSYYTDQFCFLLRLAEFEPAGVRSIRSEEYLNKSAL